MFRTRFAPSPNGLLHIGHGYAAIMAHDLAREQNGEFCLRIEDIDPGRSRAEFVEAIIADLRWLGLEIDGEIVFQSQRHQAYRKAVDRLQSAGMLYPCFCTRKDIAAAAQAHGQRSGPDGPLYPGTCRNLGQAERAALKQQRPFGLRLDMARALDAIGDRDTLRWQDLHAGWQQARPEDFGDVLLVRKDAPASYHLASVVDDALDAMSHIVRGRDLMRASDVHVLLQQLLDLPHPVYAHHGLLCDEHGAKFAKSNQSRSLADWRTQGMDGAEMAQLLREHRFPAGISLV